MVGKLFASVPGQRPVKLAGQSLRVLDQCRDDAFGVLVSNLDQHHVARMAFDKRCNIAVSRPADQIAFPMAGDRTIFDRWRSFTDGYGVLDLARSASCWCAWNDGPCALPQPAICSGD